MGPNARHEPRPIAGATQERKLLGVGSTAMLGPAWVSRGLEERFLAPFLIRFFRNDLKAFIYR